MRSGVLNFFNIRIDSFVVFMSVAFLILLIAFFFLVMDYYKMRKRYMEFMKGESGKDLEYTIYKRFREIDTLKSSQKDNDDQIAIMYERTRQSYSKLGIYKYDAFNMMNDSSSSNNSFAITLLNYKNDGFIMNVIHSRAGCHVYMKEIQNGSYDSVLSDEEKISLERAMEQK